MNPKVFAFDLDGTLLSSKKAIFATNLKSLNQALDLGHKVIIATGRNLSQITPYLQVLSRVQYFITSNGGAIYDNFTHTIRYLAKPLDQTVVETIVNLAKEIKRELQFTNYTRLYRVYFGTKIRDDITEPNFFADASQNPHYDEWETVSDLIKGPIIRIALRCERKLREPILASLLAKYEGTKLCHLAQSGNAYIECDGYDVCKYHALTQILSTEELANLYYFGDSENDLSILQVVKHSVAMGNASSEIKQRCQYVIGDNNSLAIAEFLQKLL